MANRLHSILKDKIFISTRADEQTQEWKPWFEHEEAVLLSMPTIVVTARMLSAEEKTLLQNIQQFDWLVFTSANGVKFFFDNIPTILAQHTKIAVVGTKTAQQLANTGYQASVISNKGNASDLVSELATHVQPQHKLLFVTGTLAPDTLTSAFENIQRINVYETHPTEQLDTSVLQKIANNDYDMLLFASPSAVDNFCRLATQINTSALKTACIGHTTAQAAINSKISPLVIAPKPDVQSLVVAIKNYYQMQIKD